MIHGLTATRVEIPHEPGEWIEIRDTLSPWVKEKSQVAAVSENMIKGGRVAREIGVEGFRAVVELLEDGKSPEAIKRDLDARAAGDVVLDAKAANGADSPPSPDPAASTGEGLPAPPTPPEGAPGAANGLTPAKSPIELRAERRKQFDLDVAAHLAVVCWSYRHPITDKPVPPTVDHIRNLDVETRRFIHDATFDRLDKTEDFAGN